MSEEEDLNLKSLIILSSSEILTFVTKSLSHNHLNQLHIRMNHLDNKQDQIQKNESNWTLYFYEHLQTCQQSFTTQSYHMNGI